MPSTSSAKSTLRPGGRSARVQAAVHAAVNELQADAGRQALTVPAIAARAGVTPSTIYRRWGELADLLADVAIERMRPDMEPADTGTLTGDLEAWSEQYMDEMHSDIGRVMLRDVLAGTGQPGGQPVPCRCYEFTMGQLETILSRARDRGEKGLPKAEELMDRIVAPIIYRVLFAPAPPDASWLHRRVRAGLARRD